jgi:hypothetical protein
MILHRLKRQTAKIKIDLLMFFAKNGPKMIFSVVKQKVMLIFPHVGVVISNYSYHQMIENCTIYNHEEIMSYSEFNQRKQI